MTRPIARRRARALFDLAAGFVYSQIVFACVRLDVFALLRAGPVTGALLAPRLGLSEAATERLLDGAVALRLVERRGGGRYGLGVLGAALDGNPGVAALIEHHSLLYADLADPVALLRRDGGQGALAQYWAYAREAGAASLAPGKVAEYSALMAGSNGFVADQVLDAYAVKRHRVLLDVGGGDGAFLIEAGRRAPGLRLMLFDLPAVAARAEQLLADAGLAGRCAVSSGDFLRDALPEGADLISLVRVVHDHDDAAALSILRAARAALAPGGTLLLAEPMAGTAGAAPVGDAYFGFYLLAMGSGRPRSPEMLAEMLREAGFARPQLRRTAMPMLTRLIVART